MIKNDTICALATANGMGAIAIIRLSGKKSIPICEKIFFQKKKNISLSKEKSHTIHYGVIKEKEIIDEVVISLFKSPNSYTGEDIIEISCHGSIYIQQTILNLLIKKGARMAKAGEFTLRAFINGKIDLSQAEAVSDLITSESENEHRTAMQHMRGGFSSEIKILRSKLIHFASLIELELDFSEEDVEFADRNKLSLLINELEKKITPLIDSFLIGNVLKNGISVAIVGEPNVGKSTLLNTIVNDNRAIVSNIPGTTRDTIEDEIILDGIKFRFIDTAGIRKSSDTIEKKGIKRTFNEIKKADVVLYLLDGRKKKEILRKNISNFKKDYPNIDIITLVNKCDLIKKKNLFLEDSLIISAKQKTNINKLTQELVKKTRYNKKGNSTVIVTNSRHYQALKESAKALKKIKKSISQKTESDLIAIDIRTALHHLGEITGEITTDDLLDNIFKNFCIGK